MPYLIDNARDIDGHVGALDRRVGRHVEREAVDVAGAARGERERRLFVAAGEADGTKRDSRMMYDVGGVK